jgi:mono/diheme cytochrome c family protein
MQDQPKMKAFRASTFFRDGQSSRPLIDGTIPRGWLRADTEFYTGKKKKTPGAPIPTPATAAATTAAFADDVETFPFPITAEVLARGQARYQIFCSVCHGQTGQGDGMIVRRGFRQPPSLNEQRLREAPVGHFFDAVTNGWGAMPSYAAQIPAPDRWAIIAYIRALQLSQPVAKSSSQQSIVSSQSNNGAQAPRSAAATPAKPTGGKQ